LLGQPKLRHIGATWHLNAKFLFAPRFLVIYGQTFTDFVRRNTDSGVETRIVVGAPPENLNSDNSLFEILGPTVQAALGDEL
jgi:hypothetical protein